MNRSSRKADIGDIAVASATSVDRCRWATPSKSSRACSIISAMSPGTSIPMATPEEATAGTRVRGQDAQRQSDNAADLDAPPYSGNRGSILSALLARESL